MKDKTFFFADYEGVRQTKAGLLPIPSLRRMPVTGLLCSTQPSCGGAQSAHPPASSRN